LVQIKDQKQVIMVLQNKTVKNKKEKKKNHTDVSSSVCSLNKFGFS